MNKLLLIVSLLIVIVVGGIWYYFQAKRDITSFVSDDFNLTIYLKKEIDFGGEFTKRYLGLENFSYKEALILSSGREDTVIVFRDLRGQLPTMKDYKRVDFGEYTIFCSKEDLCEIIKKNYQSPKKSLLRELLFSKKGDFVIASKMRYKGKDLKLVFWGKTFEDLLEFDGEIVAYNESEAKKLKKTIDAISLFIDFMGIKGIEIDARSEGDRVFVSGKIDKKEIEESLSKINATLGMLNKSLPIKG